MFRSRTALQLEILALRHQLGVRRRSVKRPKLTTGDRFFWAQLSRLWRDWRSAVVIVKPETVIGWHRKGVRLFWTWKVRHGQPGRPPVPLETRRLIRRMSRDNRLWGAPRIHGELFKLGTDIGETSVGKYKVRGRKPPSQTWRTFLENHIKAIVSVDFFTVPTVRLESVCLLGTSTRSPPNRSFWRHCTPDGGMDGPATSRGVSMGQRTSIPVTGSGPDLLLRVPEGSKATRYSGSARDARRTETASVRRAGDWDNSPRVSRGCDRIR